MPSVVGVVPPCTHLTKAVKRVNWICPFVFLVPFQKVLQYICSLSLAGPWGSIDLQAGRRLLSNADLEFFTISNVGMGKMPLKFWHITCTGGTWRC